MPLHQRQPGKDSDIYCTGATEVVWVSWRWHVFFLLSEMRNGFWAPSDLSVQIMNKSAAERDTFPPNTSTEIHSEADCSWASHTHTVWVMLFLVQSGGFQWNADKQDLYEFVGNVCMPLLFFRFTLHVKEIVWIFWNVALWGTYPQSRWRLARPQSGEAGRRNETEAKQCTDWLTLTATINQLIVKFW